MTPAISSFLYLTSPISALMGTACVLIMLEWFSIFRHSLLKFLVAALGIAAAGYFTWVLCHNVGASIAGTEKWVSDFLLNYRLDSLSVAGFAAILGFTFIALLGFWGYFSKHVVFGEIQILSLFIAAGMMLLISADSLLMVFLALELFSLPTYVLVGIHRDDKYSTEAALKYFLFGSFASVLLILGIALLYAQFGTLLIPQIAQALSTFITQPGANLGLVYASLVLFIAAVGFKVGVVPFHMWVPDVYQGAPASITGWMGSAIKFAGFILATRIFWGIYAPLAIQWTAWLQVIALTTMFVGNLAALAQDNLKRLFAYSSISHAGYLLFAVSTLTPGAVDVGPIYYYLVVYGLMFLGLFGCLAFLESSSKSTEVYQLSGMGFTHPLLGVCMAVFALSAAGIPPTAGFFAKYFILLQAVKSGQTIATVIAVLSSVIGVYYYLRVLVYLYMKESKETVSLQKNKLGYLAVVFCAVCLLIAAVCPSPNVIPH